MRDDFSWHGYEFRAGTRTPLDLHGTNHDRRIWDAPEAFQPECFTRWFGSTFAFVPQGGGDPHLHCPGERIAIELMKLAVDFLLRRMEYEVPPQDLTVDESRLPALPRSRFVMTHVQAR